MNLSIRTLLTGPLLVLTLVPAAIVGVLFYSNSQNAVRQTVDDLFEQISARTQNQLELYLSTPHFINQLNASAFDQDLLPLEDLDAQDFAKLERYFKAQFRAAYQTGQLPEDNGAGEIQADNKTESPREDNEFVGSINHVYVGAEAGWLRGAEYRSAEDLIAISRAEIDPNTNRGVFYQVDDNDILLEPPVPYSVLERPWYLRGKDLWPEKEAGWSAPYCDQSTQRPAITAVRPITVDGELVGVLGSDFLFDDIQRFLENLLADLNVHEGYILVLDEHDALMIAAAKGTSSAVSHDPGQVSSQRSGLEQDSRCDPKSNNLTLATPDKTVAQLLQKILGQGSVAPPTPSTPFHRFKTVRAGGRERYFWDTVSFKDGYGLTLSVLIAVPENSFIAQINKSTRNTVWLGLVTLGVAGGLGVWLARWMVKPVLTLESATRQLPQAIHDDYILLPPTIQNPSELRALSLTFGSMSTQLRELFKAFGHFVPQNFLTVLGYDDATQVKLGSYKTLKMTILFADIRSFTQISESMTPEENFKFINDYLSAMEPAISQHHGFIDKYIGDAIMALFDGDRSPDHAVQAGLNMLERLHDYNQTWIKGSDSSEHGIERPPIKIGIGVHTGTITLGTLGGKNRWDTTVIGREVNLASRLEGLTKKFGAGLLISGTTLAQLTKDFQSRYLGTVTVRGVDNAIKVYELYGADPDPLRQGKILTHETFQSALDLYEQGQYSQSLNVFERALIDFPEDRAAQFYIQQCQDYLKRE